MRIYIIFSLLITLSCYANGQSDSIKSVFSKHILISALDSISKEIKQSQTTPVINFGMFGYATQHGVLIWKDKNNFKGIKIVCQGSNIKKKKIATSVVKKITESSLLSKNCEVCNLLNGGKKASISHEFVMYLKRYTELECDEIYFTYSTYLYNKETCLGDLKYLISL